MDCKNFKIHLIPLVTTKKVYGIYSKGNENEIKICHYKIIKQKKTGMLEMRDKNTENKEQNDRSKLFFISNYFKCKWIELPSKKEGIGKMD